MEMFLFSTQNIRYGGKVGHFGAVLVLLFFLEEMCFECSGGTFRRYVFLEQEFRWVITKMVVNGALHGNEFLYSATLKSAGYHVIPSIQKLRSSVRPSVRPAVCPYVRPSAHRFHSLLGAF